MTKDQLILKQQKEFIKSVSAFKFKRSKYKRIEFLLKNNKSILLSGLRQIGKTVLMKQILMETESDSLFINIEDICDGSEQEQIIENFYYNYKKKIFLIDEIQNIKNWGDWIIKIYNKFPMAQFIVSGSASIKVSNTSGSARFIQVLVEPLSISEYIQITNQKVRGIELLNQYIGKEAITSYTGLNINYKDVKSDYFDTYVYKDIVKYENNIVLSDLKKLIEILKWNTSGEFSKRKIVDQIWKNDNYDQNKIKLNYLLEVLIKYNVIFRIKRKNIQGAKSKVTKYYFNPHLFLILHEETFNSINSSYKGYIVESLLIKYKFNDFHVHYIKQNNNVKYAKQEIDIVFKNNWFEVKSSEHNVKQELNKLFLEFNKKDLNKTILSFSNDSKISGIKNINILKFLLDE